MSIFGQSLVRGVDAAASAAAASEEDAGPPAAPAFFAPPARDWSLHGQVTYQLQSHGPFDSPYERRRTGWSSTTT